LILRLTSSGLGLRAEADISGSPREARAGDALILAQLGEFQYIGPCPWECGSDRRTKPASLLALGGIPGWPCLLDLGSGTAARPPASVRGLASTPSRLTPAHIPGQFHALSESRVVGRLAASWTGALLILPLGRFHLGLIRPRNNRKDRKAAAIGSNWLRGLCAGQSVVHLEPSEGRFRGGPLAKACAVCCRGATPGPRG